MTTSNFSPSPEQQAILAWQPSSGSAKRHLQIRAGAGCGKTTVMVEYIRRNAQAFQGPVLCVAFNKAIAETLASRTEGLAKCATFNSIGHRALMRFLPGRVNLQSSKLWTIMKELRDESDMTEDEWEEVSDDIVALARKARHAGIVVDGSRQGYTALTPDQPEAWLALGDDLFRPASAETIALARELLLRSTDRVFSQSEIDFDDQVYISALWGAPYDRFALVLTDESQDASPLNHVQIAKSLRPGATLIAVGDPRQAIYGFRGADENSMSTLAERFKPDILPLMTTFRCPQAVVREANKIEPKLLAAPTNPQGKVVNWTQDWTHEDIPDGAAILCRNNAPIIELAFKLLAERRRVRIQGREFGTQLKKLVDSITKRNIWPVDMFLGKLGEWRDECIAKAKGKGQGLIEDKYACLSVIAQQAKDTKEMHKAIDALFEGKDASITLSSMHRAKGLEWTCVFILDRFRVPSRYAQTESALTQEWNLMYVAQTRSMGQLVYIDLERYAPLALELQAGGA